MCGIVGYCGNNNCIPVLLDGLDSLEYRGYDSAGVAFFTKDKKQIETVKKCGRISVLKDFLASKNLQSDCGIAHTRWATHGIPSDINSHPHTTDELSLVHNGIIENYSEIEQMLLLRGYTFISQTDTERAAKLIDCIYKREHDPVRAIFLALNIIRGSFAFAIIFKDFPNKIYAIRKDSPLILAKDEKSTYLASDIPAILPYTNEYYRLAENTLAILSADKIELLDSDLSSVTPQFEIAKWSFQEAKRGGFPHFMLKEIYEEPAALNHTLMHKIRNCLPFFGEDFFTDEELWEITSIHIVACGTAMHAGLVGKYIIEKLACIPVNVEIASEFRYRNPIIDKSSLTIFISQSGETADTLASLRLAKSKKIKNLAIVNVFGSTLSCEADHTVYTSAGPEISVASTKAYSVQCSVLYLFAIHLGKIKERLSEESAKELCKTLSNELPKRIAATLTLNDKIKKIAKKISPAEHAFYIGRGIDYYLCIEASLKLKEISYIHSEAYAAGELKHGTISLISDGTPVISILTDEALCTKSESNIREVQSRGANVTAICTPETDAKCSNVAIENKIVLPAADALLYPFLAATAVQLLAYHVSDLRGLDVDKPRNLAKSVTVE